MVNVFAAGPKHDQCVSPPTQRATGADQELSIAFIAPSSLAFNSGLQVGDNISHINDRPLIDLTDQELSDVIFNHRGEKIKLSINRGKTKKDVIILIPLEDRNHVRDLSVLGIGYSFRKKIFCESTQLKSSDEIPDVDYPFFRVTDSEFDYLVEKPYFQIPPKKISRYEEFTQMHPRPFHLSFSSYFGYAQKETDGPLNDFGRQPTEELPYNRFGLGISHRHPLFYSGIDLELLALYSNKGNTYAPGLNLHTGLVTDSSIGFGMEVTGQYYRWFDFNSYLFGAAMFIEPTDNLKLLFGSQFQGGDLTGMAVNLGLRYDLLLGSKPAKQNEDPFPEQNVHRMESEEARYLSNEEKKRNDFLQEQAITAYEKSFYQEMVEVEERIPDSHSLLGIDHPDVKEVLRILDIQEIQSFCDNFPKIKAVFLSASEEVRIVLVTKIMEKIEKLDFAALFEPKVDVYSNDNDIIISTSYKPNVKRIEELLMTILFHSTADPALRTRVIYYIVRMKYQDMWTRPIDELVEAMLSDPDESIRLMVFEYRPLKDTFFQKNEKWLEIIARALTHETNPIIRKRLWKMYFDLDTPKLYLKNLTPRQTELFEKIDGTIQKNWELRNHSTANKKTDEPTQRFKEQMLKVETSIDQLRTYVQSHLSEYGILLKESNVFVQLKLLNYLKLFSLRTRLSFKKEDIYKLDISAIKTILKNLFEDSSTNIDVRYLAADFLIAENDGLEFAHRLKNDVRDPRLRLKGLKKLVEESQDIQDESLAKDIKQALDVEVQPVIRSQLWQIYFRINPDQALEQMQREYFKVSSKERDFFQALAYKTLQKTHGLLIYDPEKEKITTEELYLILQARFGKNITVAELAMFYPKATLPAGGMTLEVLSVLIYPSSHGKKIKLGEAVVDKNGDLDVTSQFQEELKQWAPKLVLRNDDEIPIPLDHSLHGGSIVLNEEIQNPLYRYRYQILKNSGLLITFHKELIDEKTFESVYAGKRMLPLDEATIDQALQLLGYHPQNLHEIDEAIKLLGLQETHYWIPPLKNRGLQQALIRAGYDPFNPAQMEAHKKNLGDTIGVSQSISVNGQIFDIDTIIMQRKHEILFAMKRRFLLSLFDFDGVEVNINREQTDRPSLNNNQLGKPVIYASARISPLKLLELKDPTVIFHYRRFNNQSYTAQKGFLSKTRVQHPFDNESHYIELDLRTMTLNRTLLGRHYYGELYDRKRLMNEFIRTSPAQEKDQIIHYVQKIINGEEQLPVSIAYYSHGSDVAFPQSQNKKAGLLSYGIGIAFFVQDVFPGTNETKGTNPLSRIYDAVDVIPINQDPFSMNTQIQFGITIPGLFKSGNKPDRDGMSILVSRTKGLEYYYEQVDDYQIMHEPEM